MHRFSMKSTEKGMVQNVKKLFVLLLAAAALMTFAACNSEAGGGETETEEDPDKSDLAAVIDIVKEGASDYVIMRSDLVTNDSAATKAAIALRSAIKEATGVELTLATDWSKSGDVPTDTLEILVGDTNRPESTEIKEGLGVNEYAVRLMGNRLVINATSSKALTLAVENVIAELLGYDRESGSYSATVLSVPVGYSTTGEYNISTYTYSGKQIEARPGLTTTTPDSYLMPEIILTDKGYTQKFVSYDVTGCMTSLQTNSGYQELGHVNCDSIMIYSTYEPVVTSWTDHEDIFNIDMMIAINRADMSWAEANSDSIQTKSDGSWMLHPAGASYYMVPTEEFIEYLWEQVEWSIVTYRPCTIAFEEPEMFNASGYSQGFKDEWYAYFGEDWQDPTSSPEALVKSMELKTYLFERIISVFYERIKAIAPETNLYIATHSTVNYNAWNITAGLNHYMATGKVDGIIGQTWSDTIRSAYTYKGRGTKDEFLNAYAEFISYTDSVEGTNFYALADPMCDSTSSTEEKNRFAYLQTIVASLLQPEIHRFEICPWLSRAFEQVSSSYRTVLQQCFNALNEVGGKEITLEAGTPGIYYAVSDTMSWLKSSQWSPDTSVGYYGIVMPLATAGIPVGVKSMEHITSLDDLADVKILIISYDIMLPMSETVNDVVAEWVKSGGTLMLLSGCNSYWEAEDRFWNTGDNKDGSPVANLMKKLGVNVTVEKTTLSENAAWEGLDSMTDSITNKSMAAYVRRFTITYSGDVKELLSVEGKTLGFESEVGKGQLIAVGLPSSYYASASGCELMLALTEYATAYTDVQYVETNLMTVRRGNIVATHALVNDDKLEGTYIDIFDERLTVVTDPTVTAKDSRLLYATDQFDLSVPRFGYSGGELVEGSLVETADKTVFSYTSASSSTVSTRLLAPKGRYPVSATATCNGNRVEVIMNWNNATSSLLLQNDGNAQPTEITVTWGDTPVKDGQNVYYAEEGVAVNEQGEDAAYLIVNTAGANSGLRFCDRDLELVYKFDISEQPGVAYTFTLSQNYVAEVSADGETWTQVADYSQGGTVPHLTTGGNTFLLQIYPADYGCTDTFYFHLYNSDTTQGWGGSLSYIKWRYQITEEEAIARGLIGENDIAAETSNNEPTLDDSKYISKTEDGLNYYKRTVKTNSKELDLDYLYEGSAGANETLRYCDMSNYLIYYFDLTGASDFEINMQICQNYLIEVSGDMNDWIEVADYSQGGTVPHLANGSNAKSFKLKASDYGLDGKKFYICLRSCYPDQGHGGAISQFIITYTRPAE